MHIKMINMNTVTTITCIVNAIQESRYHACFGLPQHSDCIDQVQILSGTKRIVPSASMYECVVTVFSQ